MSSHSESTNEELSPENPNFIDEMKGKMEILTKSFDFLAASLGESHKGDGGGVVDVVDEEECGSEQSSSVNGTEQNEEDLSEDSRGTDPFLSSRNQDNFKPKLINNPRYIEESSSNYNADDPEEELAMSIDPKVYLAEQLRGHSYSPMYHRAAIYLAYREWESYYHPNQSLRVYFEGTSGMVEPALLLRCLRELIKEGTSKKKRDHAIYVWSLMLKGALMQKVFYDAANQENLVIQIRELLVTFGERGDQMQQQNDLVMTNSINYQKAVAESLDKVYSKSMKAEKLMDSIIKNMSVTIPRVQVTNPILPNPQVDLKESKMTCLGHKVSIKLNPNPPHVLRVTDLNNLLPKMTNTNSLLKLLVGLNSAQLTYLHGKELSEIWISCSNNKDGLNKYLKLHMGVQ